MKKTFQLKVIIIKQNQKKLKVHEILTEYYNFCYKDNQVVTKFNLKSTSKSAIYYVCYKRAKGCTGLAIFDIKTKEFRIYNSCNFKIEHEEYNYDRIYKFNNK